LQLATQLLRYSDDLFAEVLKYKVILTFDKVQSESWFPDKATYHEAKTVPARCVITKTKQIVNWKTIKLNWENMNAKISQDEVLDELFREH